MKRKLTDISAEQNALYGAEGTAERAKFDGEAWNFYTSQILLDPRVKAKVTQSELARRLCISQ